MNNNIAQCTSCNIKKPVDEFSKDRSKPSGHKSICKACDRKKSKTYYEESGRRSRGHSKRTEAESLPCRTCGTSFKARKQGQTYCSRTCAGRSRRTYKPGRQLAMKSCDWCEHVFTPTHPSQVVCSKNCRDSRNHMIRKEKWHRRRALMVGSTIEKINVNDIYERDSWLCGICNIQIDKELRYPHPKSASLDHVIPLSKGGTHTEANLQPAHLMCNSVKGNRLAA